MVVDTSGRHRVLFIGNAPAHDDEFDVFFGHPRAQQRNIFRDRIIFAIAVTGRQRFEGRAPPVRNAPLIDVALRSDGQIDRPVDDADPSQAGARATLCDNVKELARGRRAFLLRQAAIDNGGLGIDLIFAGAGWIAVGLGLRR